MFEAFYEDIKFDKLYFDERYGKSSTKLSKGLEPQHPSIALIQEKFCDDLAIPYQI